MKWQSKTKNKGLSFPDIKQVSQFLDFGNMCDSHAATSTELPQVKKSKGRTTTSSRTVRKRAKDDTEEKVLKTYKRSVADDGFDTDIEVSDVREVKKQKTLAGGAMPLRRTG